MVEDAGAGTEPRFLGRSEELDRIDDMVERLATGRGSVVVLIGPPGIGLTTLLREAISRTGQAVEDVRAVHVPSGLLEGDAAAALAAIASGNAAEAVRGAAATAEETLSEAGSSLFLDDPRLVRAAVGALRALSSERPLLVTVDNLPWEDDSVFTALTSLAAGVAVMPVMVVATSHVLPSSSYEESPVGPLWVRRVPPLPMTESVALVRHAAARWVPSSVAATIGHRTGGNPGDLVAVCGQLEPDQLAGLEPLPDMLPGTPVTTARYRHWWESLAPRERLLVLCTAVAVTADRGALEESAGATIADVVGSDGEPVLREENGLVTSDDPRLLSAVCALSASDELRAARKSLADRYPEQSLERRWHDIRSGRRTTPEELRALTGDARVALDRGEAATVSSLVADVARALAPATPPSELLLLGGVAALYCGHTGRAVTLLGSAVGEAPDSLERLFPPLLIAVSHRDKTVPHHLVSSCLARLEQARPQAAASIAATAARLCAEYGDEPAARRYLHRAESLTSAVADPGHELATELTLSHAMLGQGPAGAGEPDALSGLASGRPGLDVAGWQSELQTLAQLIGSRSWTRARGAISDLRSRLQRCPAPLLRAQLATLSVRFHLALGECRRAEEVAASAVEERLPLHVPQGGAGIAQLAQVAFLRGRRADAECWLNDLVELVQGYQDVPLLATALHETLGLRAQLVGDLEEAAEHYSRALEGGALLSPSTPLDLIRLRWRAWSTEPGPEALLSRAWAGNHSGEIENDTALAMSLDLLRAPAEAVVKTVASVAGTARDTVLPVHEAQLLELASDRVGALTTDHYALQARSAGPDLPRERDRYRSLLLRRARQLYQKCGAGARVAVTERELTALERAPVPDDVDIHSLTPDELRVARLVHRGSSNREVASELYLSVRTVELRLTSVYRKLGIRSRRELRQLRSLAPDETVR